MRLQNKIPEAAAITNKEWFYKWHSTSHLLTYSVKGVPGNYIVPNHATDEPYLQFRLLHNFHDTCMDAISVTLDGSVLAVKAQRPVLVRGRLQGDN